MTDCYDVHVLAAARLIRGCSLTALLVIGGGGCVGSITTREFTWSTVQTDLRTKSEVVARFGRPGRTVEAGGRERWYYRSTTSGPSGRPPYAGVPNALFLLIVPIFWTSRPDYNLMFQFNGDALVSASEVTGGVEHHAHCGLNVFHGRDLFMCTFADL